MPTEDVHGRQRRFEPTQGVSCLHCREKVELAVETSGDTVERTVVAQARKANTFRTDVSWMFVSVLYRALCASSFICVVLANSLEPHQLPDWLQHMFGHMFMHQDMVFLHHQASLGSRGVLSSRAYRCSRRPRPPPSPRRTSMHLLAARAFVFTLFFHALEGSAVLPPPSST